MIQLNESDLSSLIKKVVNSITENVITESVSDEVYHFTRPDQMLEILKTNKINLSPTFGISADSSLNHNKLYSLSLTTSKNTTIGYKGTKTPEYICRIQFSGRELNYNFKSKHVDYWQSSRDPKTYKDLSLDMISHKDEMEERILSDRDNISPASRYIISIDLIDTYKEPQRLIIFSQIKELAKSLNIPCYFYNDAKSFNFSIKQNVIELPTTNEPDESRNYDKSNYDAIRLFALASYGNPEIENKIISGLSSFKVDSNDLKQRIDKEINDFKYEYFRHLDDYRLRDLEVGIQANVSNNRATTNELTRFALRMLGYDMKKNNCNSLMAYFKFKIFMGKKTQKQYNEEFSNKLTQVIDKSYQEQLPNLNRYQFESIDGEYYSGNVIKFVPEIKKELDRIIYNIKQYCNNYILKNNDMFKYSYVISGNEIKKQLKLEDIDYKFCSNIIEYNNSKLSEYDIKQVIDYVLYDIDDFYYKEIQRMQTEEMEQWNK